MPDSKTPAAVTAAGVVAILGSLLVLLGALLGTVGIYITPSTTNSPGLPPLVMTLTECILAFVLALGVFGVITGISLLRLKNWARISTLIWSGLTVVFCLLTVATLAVTPFPTPPNSPVNAGFVRGAAIGFYLLPLAIGIWWLILFSRKSIAAQFAKDSAALDLSGFPGEIQSTPKQQCPLPVMVLAGFLVFCGLSVFVVFLFPLPVLLFGHSFSGSPGRILWIASCFSVAAAGIGLLRLRPWGYWLALGLQGFWFLSGIVTLSSPKYPQAMQEMLTRMRDQLGDSSSNYTLEQLRPYSYLGLAMPIIIGAILLFYRSRFFDAVEARSRLAQTPPGI